MNKMSNIKKVGENEFLVTIYNSKDLEVTLSSFGAGLRSVKYKGKEMLLTPNDYEDYKYCTSYFGKTCGRFAGRIQNGKTTINGKEYQVSLNEPTNSLHGGKNGYSFKNFDMKLDGDEKFTYVIFEIDDKFNNELPGNMKARVVYRIDNTSNKIGILYWAISDEDTIFNPTGHSYWNLSGDLKTDITNHYFKLNCDKYAILDDKLIFTGVADVDDVLDFQKGKLIGKDIKDPSISGAPTGGYDHLWIKKDKENNEVCVLEDKESGTKLTIYSDYPSVVCYTYNWPLDLEFTPSKKVAAHYGIAIEPELEPMSVSKENFEKGILKKESEFNHYIIYDFDD